MLRIGTRLPCRHAQRVAYATAHPTFSQPLARATALSWATAVARGTAGSAAPGRRPLALVPSATATGDTSANTAQSAAVGLSRPGPVALPDDLIIRLPGACQVPAVTLPFMHQALEHYTARTPSLHTVLERVMRPGWPGVSELGHDHFAFRTFGVPGLGIASLERVLLPLGYLRVDEQPPLAFPGKKLLASWFTPADPRVRATLPRVFVSELQVERLSECAQQVIRGATAWAAEAGPEAATVQVLTALLTGTAPWPVPTLEQYERLLGESEYAAWVLAHGYSLNHTALALHRLPPMGRGADITEFVGRLQRAGMEMNADGGVVKVSPDGLLQQCAVLADTVPFTFACGQTRSIAGAYVEFVQRLRLPRFAALRDEQVREEHLREGFEVGNADRIFASTTLASTRRG